MVASCIQSWRSRERKERIAIDLTFATGARQEHHRRKDMPMTSRDLESVALTLVAEEKGSWRPTRPSPR